MTSPDAKRRKGRTPRQKPREEQAETLRQVWGEKKKVRLAELKALHSRSVKDIDLYGRAMAEGDVPDEDIRGEDVALGLARAFAATGDPVFSDALAALREYALAGGKPRASYDAAWRRSWGDPDVGYLKHMRWLIENRSISIRAAADEVAAKSFVDADTFEAATRSLRDSYSKWEKAGFPEDYDIDPGDTGYLVLVRPVAGRRVINPAGPRELPAEGTVVKYTTYWRQRFAEGDIEISRVENGRKTP